LGGSLRGRSCQLYGYSRTCRLRATRHGPAQIPGSKSQDQAPGFRWWGTDRNGVHLQDRLPSAIGNYWSARDGKDVRCRSNLRRRPNLGSFSKEKTPALRSDQWHHVHSIFRNWRKIAITLTTGFPAQDFVPCHATPGHLPSAGPWHPRPGYRELLAAESRTPGRCDHEDRYASASSSSWGT
jgi:hypothetical protein